MLGLIHVAFSLLLNTAYEVVIYIFVDIVVKNFLQEARNEGEKRAIWMYESVALMALCVGLYLLHHTPYLLLISAVATLIYTQLVGRVNFRYWWFQLITRWDEFQQHEESMEQYNSMQQQQTRLNNSQHPPPNMQVTMGPTHTQHWMPQPQAAPMPITAFPPDASPRIDPPSFPQFEAWYPADQNKKSVASNAGPVSSTPLPSGPATFGVRQRNMTDPMPTPIYPHAPPPQPAFVPMYPPPVMVRPDLVRRPINSRTSSVVPTSLGLSERVKNKVRSAFGMPDPPTTPPGLPNHGNNLCFLNAVLQCIANSPGVTESLVYQAQTQQPLKCSDQETVFVSAMTQLFEKLRSPPTQPGTIVEDTEAFREAASQLRGDIVASPSQPGAQQEQQDAAEYLMWTLSALHAATNAYSPTQQNNNQLNHSPHNPHHHLHQHQVFLHMFSGVQRFTNMNLNMLKFMYADLTPQRIEQLKLDCRKEIEKANGVDTNSYAEPIQRLSDLEWLSYKDKNRSVIDDLFTGQLVEAQHCLACQRVSVGVQAFNILPVPIVEPRQMNGLVYLEDCFTKFGNIEDLVGPDGLQCENCNRMDLGASPILCNGGRATAGGALLRQRPAPRRLVQHPTDSPINPHVAAMSPIPGGGGGGAGEMLNDSGYNDTNIRTSTPIGAPLSVPLTSKLTDGQKRSLLRQLPDCLIVQLMRFTVRRGSNVPRKLHAPVTIPLTQLDLTQVVIDNVMQGQPQPEGSSVHPGGGGFRYSLYGVCLHLGADNTNCGHYVAYVRSGLSSGGADNNAWYRCDDASVTPVNMEYELNTRQVRENAYLLFYKKVM